MTEFLDENIPEIKSRKNIIIRNGVIFVFILIIMLLLTHMMQDVLMEHTNIIAGIEYLLFLVAIIITQIQVRESVYDGKMRYGEAFGSGMLFVVLVTVAFSLFTLIFYLVAGTELLTEMVQIAENSLREQGRSEEEIEMQMWFSNRIFTPVGMFVMVVFMYMFIGVIYSLIASIFTQRTT